MSGSTILHRIAEVKLLSSPEVFLKALTKLGLSTHIVVYDLMWLYDLIPGNDP